MAATVYPEQLMHSARVPPSSAGETLIQVPLVRWTRYGRWSECGTLVYNERGDVIYELKL